MSQDILGGSSSSGHMPSSHTSSPVVSSGVASQPLSLSQGRSQQSNESSEEDSNNCPVCQKTFKTSRSLNRHKIVHIQEVSMTGAHKEELLNICEEIAEQKLLEMLEDPSVSEFGSEKKMYIQALLSKVAVADEHWVAFNEFIVDRITIIFCKRSRALPMRQYEDHLTLFTKWLGENIQNDVIPSLLNSVMEASKVILRNVPYRFATKNFESLAAYQASLFVKRKSGESSKGLDLSWSEKQSLYYACGYVVRKIRRKKCSSDIGERRVRCINERICFNSEEEYSEEFLKLKEWFDCLDRGGLVAVNENFFTCILKIEEVIQKCFASCSTAVTKRLVLNEIYKLENTFLLDLWYIITQGMLEENDALTLFELFV